MKKIRLLTVMTIAAIVLGGCTPTDDNPNTTASDYYPIGQNVRYYYEGSGNEYASYDVHIDYTSENMIQRRINNGGTESVSVIEISDGKVSEVFFQGETYYRENFLDSTNKDETLIQDPIAVGTTWELSDGRNREITNLDVAIETPSGNYEALEITTVTDDYTTIDYYAKDVGLVRSVFTTGADEISSTLATIEKNTSWSKNISFYYPNINDGLLYYKTKNVEFSTNDITNDVLSATYKADIPTDTGTVLSANTKINSLYLNEDGMAYLDLSSEYLSEMNAGAQYESMMLQCIANTFGNYYMVEKVLLTIDGNEYESGHIALAPGEYLVINNEGNVALDD